MPPNELKFFIAGKPAPGGSKRAFMPKRKDGAPVRRKNGSIMINIVDDAGAPNKLWKSVVAMTAKAFMKGARPFACPVKVEFVFYLRRPQNHYRTGKLAHMLRPDAPAYHTVKPDALKFARSTEDALTGVLWNDDAANVRICSEKRYLTAGETEGCAVRFVLLESALTPA